MLMNENIAFKLREEFSRFSPEGSVQESLDTLSQIIARLLCAKGCSILILADSDIAQATLHNGAQFGPLPEPLASKKPVLYAAAVAESSEIFDGSHEVHGTTESMVSAIVLQGKIVGVIHASLSLQPGGFKEDDLHLFSLLTPLVTKSIQVIHLQNILHSKFAQLAIAQSNGSVIKEIMNGIMQNPNQFARVLARSFYREMLDAGFNVNQIISVATELISELSSSLKKRSVKHKKQAEQFSLVELAPDPTKPEKFVAQQSSK
jgi:hypothetical protein